MGRFGSVWDGPPAFPPPLSLPRPALTLDRLTHAAVVGSRASRLFPVRHFRVQSTRGGTSLRVFDPSPGRSVVGARACSPGTRPRRGSGSFLRWPGRLSRVGGVSAVWGLVRPSRGPRFLASRVLPATVRVPSCRVPARRFKDPGGVAPPPPGRGAVRPVGKSVGRLALPQTPRPSSRRRRRSRGCGRVGRGCPEPPLGARGGPHRAAGLPDFRGPSLSAPVAGSCVVPVFFRSRPFVFFFFFHVSRFVSRWPA